MNKTHVKVYLRKEIQDKVDSCYGEYYKRFYRRVENICRAKINRFSFELKKEGTKIYLEKDGREIIIESKSRDENMSQIAFKDANSILKKVIEKVEAQK